jgi:hypothetical protein
VAFAVLAAVAVFGLADTTAPAASVPVLGARSLNAPNGRGWGYAQPSEIFNGGDPSGLVTHIHWSSWGGAVAHGAGQNAIFAPHGGYYGKPVTIQLAASDLGRCTAHGPLAYRKLMAREPSRPGGPVGHWFVWGGSPTICTWG